MERFSEQEPNVPETKRFLVDFFCSVGVCSTHSSHSAEWNAPLKIEPFIVLMQNVQTQRNLHVMQGEGAFHLVACCYNLTSESEKSANVTKWIKHHLVHDESSQTFIWTVLRLLFSLFRLETPLVAERLRQLIFKQTGTLKLTLIFILRTDNRARLCGGKNGDKVHLNQDQSWTSSLSWVKS